ncbi:MAG: galactose-1-phosphate uridylyltransferase [Erysipelotrichaceae bacterium]|nr:galactose-1-phosphate uridylyltransferase [Erysipelotrichaceae bacterium]
MLKDDLNLLIAYAKKNLKLEGLNEIYVRNTLMKKFNIEEEYYDTDTSIVNDLVRPDILIEKLSKDLVDNGFALEENVHLLVDEIFGDLSLSPNEFLNEFKKIEESKGKEEALEFFYDYQIKNNYIQKTAIEKNIHWNEENLKYPIEISINLSKPEKKNSDIAKLKMVKSSSYPKCLLCKENLGFYGDEKKAPRRTIRFVPLELDGEKWYLQYSPYGYYYQHAICFSDKHSDMVINKTTFKKLLQFVDLYPSFFMGSNADLPIVGGSILNHEHFQGGNYVLPLFKSSDKKEYKFDKYSSLKITKLDYYHATLKVVGDDIEEIASFADKVLNIYKNFDAEEIDLISRTDVLHSTITPICRKEKNKFALYLIFRNNRTNEVEEGGIFHAHKIHHHIKSEGIGLIEAMGLFILPPRLISEMKNISDILQGKVSKEEFNNEKYSNMIDELLIKYGNKNSLENSKNILKEYIAETCEDILKNISVFKEDELGNKYFDLLMTKVGE